MEDRSRAFDIHDGNGWQRSLDDGIQIGIGAGGARDMKLSSESRIREIVDTKRRAASAGIPEAIPEFVADDVVTLDVVAPLVSHGKQAVLKRGIEWLGSYNGQVKWEARDVEVVASADVAFCPFINRVRGTFKNSQAVDMWFRTTQPSAEGT